MGGKLFVDTNRIKHIYLNTNEIKHIYVGTDCVFSAERFIYCYRCGANAIVTGTMGGISVSATADSSGTAVLVVSDEGTWTISTTGASYTKSVTVSTAETYSVYFEYHLYYNGVSNTSLKLLSDNGTGSTGVPSPESSANYSGYMGKNCVYYSQEGGFRSYGTGRMGCYWRTGDIDCAQYSKIYFKMKGRASVGGNDLETCLGYGLTQNADNIFRYDYTPSQVCTNNLYWQRYEWGIENLIAEDWYSMDLPSSGTYRFFFGGFTCYPYYVYGDFSVKYGISEIYLT